MYNLSIKTHQGKTLSVKQLTWKILLIRYHDTSWYRYNLIILAIQTPTQKKSRANCAVSVPPVEPARAYVYIISLQTLPVGQKAIYYLPRAPSYVNWGSIMSMGDLFKYIEPCWIAAGAPPQDQPQNVYPHDLFCFIAVSLYMSPCTPPPSFFPPTNTETLS